MKRFLTAAVLAVSAAAYAGPAEDALLSAQSAYRSALKARNDNDSKLITLQNNLADAQKRAQQAQEDIARLQSEIQAASALKTEQTAALQQAGRQLDSTWNAVYGPGGTKDAQ
ncbi:hypothetical protein [Neisseria iguanae]|uniref:Periplasmic protein n=1 Tax=Neisseria iguanae TaxID=90242 RepID=A0A2P7TWX3_9NEIS|nr:hypothetical protein [Neisseria iguanae]PSJ79207.1 hypothetical protein C7N83_13645 [Neisseria iguanae]